MSLFPISSEQVQFSTAAIEATDNFVNGVLENSSVKICRAATSGGAQYSNGLLMTAAGQVVYVDATAGLPAGVQYTNGMPIASTGELCISTDAAVSYSNGLPMAANGAISATINP